MSYLLTLLHPALSNFADSAFSIICFLILLVPADFYWEEPSRLEGAEDPLELDCEVFIPGGQYFLAESFFENFDYVVRRIAFLKAYGFEKVGFVHTRCQEFDVEKDLYIVMISEPVSDKTKLYSQIDQAYQLAVKQDIKLINTRIVQAKE